MKARLATAVLLGFVLVAAASCGGSDGLSTAEEEALQERLEAAELEAQEAERLRQAEEAAREEAERLRLEEEAARQKAEEEAAEAAREAAEAERLRQAEEEARKEAEERAETAEEAQQQAEQAQQQAEQAQQQAEQAQQQQQQQLQQQLQQQQQQQQLQQQLTEAQQAEAKARARSFALQLNSPDAGSATVRWRRGDTNLTFRPTGITTTPGSAAPSVPGGWRSASFAGQTGTAATLTDETVYLYTNIQPPSSRNFWKMHAMTVIDGELEVAATAFGTLNADTVNDPAPTAAAQYIISTSDNTQASGVRVRGNYDGVPGTFTCIVPTTCTGDRTNANNNQLDLAGLVGAPVNGVRSFAGGDWSFKPGSINSRVKAEDQADQDDAFLYFGIWSSIPDEIDISDANAALYNFRYVAGGGAEIGNGLDNFGNLTGSATFRGGAVGRYTTQGQVGGQNAKIGTFTATATLNADFDANAGNGTLSGSITDFHEDGSRLAGWRVTMGSTANVGVASNITLAAVGTDDVSGATVANIGGLSVAGTWGAKFYGSDNGVFAGNPIFADRDKYPANQYPVLDLAGVAGWFNAAGTGLNDASLAGAFAATPQ